ncbi:unnamed protein product, partial [Mesorhabditis belari]|uniref:2-oxoglutarate dehydrogenase, mitochondrial n=1 Tax=Mesorhabditis belari TaxID=2138241 RepID=A0AAF3FKL3_9BILA
MARTRTTIAATQLTKPESSTKHQARAQSAAASVKHESFMNGSTSVYIEQMYAAWQEDPNSVHKSWDAYFRNVEQGAAPGQAFQAPPTGGLTLTGITQPSAGAASTALSTAGASVQSISDHLKIQLLIRSYQMRGHNVADLDPLGINSADLDDTVPPELELSFYGLNENDLERDFDIIDRLKDIYCLRTGVEYMHLTNYQQQDWIRRRFEAPRVTELSRDQKKVLFKRLIRSTKFEEFLAK